MYGYVQANSMCSRESIILILVDVIVIRVVLYHIDCLWTLDRFLNLFVNLVIGTILPGFHDIWFPEKLS